MKKYAILTSILTLAACGGGSSHHGGGAVVPDAAVVPTKPFVGQQDRVAASNAEITGMVSNSEAQVVTYVVNKLGTDAVTVGLGNTSRTATSRAAFTPSTEATGNMDYDRAKELMELAGWLGNDTTTHDDITALFNKSTEDQNKIKSALKLLDDMYCYVGGSADETATRILARRAAKDFEKPMAEIAEKSEIMTLDNVRFNVAGFNDGKIDEDYTIGFGVTDAGEIDSLAFYYKNEDGGEDKAFAGRETITDQDGNKINVFFQDVYKYKINGFTTDSLDYKIEDRDELREEIVDALTGRDATLQESVLAAFDAGQGEWVEETHRHQMDLYGKNLATKLKYMDFGYDVMLTVGDDEDEKDYSVIFGGYKNKGIEKADLSGPMEFTGMAIGAAAYEANKQNHSKTVETEQGGAKLTFKDGEETLVMPFKDYYTVTVNRDKEGASKLSFTDYKGTDAGYKFTKETNISTKDPDDLAHVMIKYYGNDKTPTEVGGTVSHEEHTNGLKSFETAFGATANK